MTRQWWTLIWLVTRREIRERSRARSFWVATAILLLAVTAGAVLPPLLRTKPVTARIGIAGTPAVMLARVAREAGRISGTPVTVVRLPDMAAGRAGLRSGRLDAVLAGDTEVLVEQRQAADSSPAGTLASSLAQVAGLAKVYAELPPAAAATLARHGIALPVRGLAKPARGQPSQITGLTSRITGLIIAILIYVIILTYGVRITVGVGEEKASRVVEVLLATLRPIQLLAGKVAGMGVLALAQIAAMAGLYLALGHALGSVALRGTATTVVLAGAFWLVLGYTFYCTGFAAAGSLINRQADAYNASLPLQLPLILAYVLSYTVIYASSVNWFYHVLAFIPFTAPVAMPVLVAVGAAPAWQFALSAAITLAASVAMVRLAGTIYERAILRTGSRVKVRQVLRPAA